MFSEIKYPNRGDLYQRETMKIFLGQGVAVNNSQVGNQTTKNPIIITYARLELGHL